MTSKKQKEKQQKKRTSTFYSILFDLALSNKKPSKWGLAKSLHKSYGNIHETIETLKRNGLINVAYSKPSIKNPKITVEHYVINIAGLFKVLCHPQILQYLDQIAEAQKDKLLLFKKWGFFKEKGVDKNVRATLAMMGQLSDRMIKMSRFFPVIWLHPDAEWSFDFIKLLIENQVFGLSFWQHPKLSSKENPGLFNLYVPIWNACKSDPELSEWLRFKIAYIKRANEEELEEIKRLEKIWEETGIPEILKVLA